MTNFSSALGDNYGSRVEDGRADVSRSAAPSPCRPGFGGDAMRGAHSLRPMDALRIAPSRKT